MGTKDRFLYETATVLDQDFLDNCQDGLTCQLEMVVDIERPDSGFIRASDRNKYKDGVFYEALLQFPVISRTVGDWLANVVEFSDIQLRLSNVDGRFNDILPGGANFNGWIGRRITVSLGLRDVGSTYTTLFDGAITDIGGFGRDHEAVIFQARDKFDEVNDNVPETVFTVNVFPNIDGSVEGNPVPIIYGDWTTELTEPADVPAFVVNALDTSMNGDVARTNNVDCVISQTTNKTFDTSQVYLFREIKDPDGKVTNYHQLSSTDIVNVSGDRNRFEIVQDSGNSTLVDSEGTTINFVFESGDEFFVQVTGVDLGIYDDNAVEQAKDVLKTYGGLVNGDFDSNWDTFRDKNSPAQSAISSIKCRIWQQDQLPAIELALSLLEQVRLEAFVSRGLLFKINSLHFEDFVAAPTKNVTNFDIERESFQPRIDVRNNFNRARGSYNRTPMTGENQRETPIFRNSAAITQQKKPISKRVIFPNLYVASDVENQLIEIIRMASATIEHIEFNATWRTLLYDIGDFFLLKVREGSTEYVDVPCMIRSVGDDPQGLKRPFVVWSTQMLPFPGYEPGYIGTVGGYNATITQE